MPSPASCFADVLDALVERRAGDPDGEGAERGAPALEPLRDRGPGLGGEVGDLELEPIDDEGADA